MSSFWGLVRESYFHFFKNYVPLNESSYNFGRCLYSYLLTKSESLTAMLIYFPAATVNAVKFYSCVIYEGLVKTATAGTENEFHLSVAIRNTYIAQNCTFHTFFQHVVIRIPSTHENCSLPGFYTASSGNFLLMFRDNLSVPSSK